MMSLPHKGRIRKVILMVTENANILWWNLHIHDQWRNLDKNFRGAKLIFFIYNFFN